MSRPLCDSQQNEIACEIGASVGPEEFWCTPVPTTSVPSTGFLEDMHSCTRLVKVFGVRTSLTSHGLRH